MDEQITKLLEKVNSYVDNIPQVYEIIRRQYAIESVFDTVTFLLGLTIIGLYFYVALEECDRWLESARIFYHGRIAQKVNLLKDGYYDDEPERKREIIEEYKESEEIYKRASRRLTNWIITLVVLCILWACIACIWVFLTPDVSFVEFLQQL